MEGENDFPVMILIILHSALQFMQGKYMLISSSRNLESKFNGTINVNAETKKLLLLRIRRFNSARCNIRKIILERIVNQGKRNHTFKRKCEAIEIFYRNRMEV